MRGNQPRKTGRLAPYRYKVDGIGLAPYRFNLFRKVIYARVLNPKEGSLSSTREASSAIPISRLPVEIALPREIRPGAKATGVGWLVNDSGAL